MTYIVVLLIITLAAIANAAMDQLKFNPGDSVFAGIKNEKIREWFILDSSAEKSWMHPFFFFLVDGWHFFKGIMVALFIGGISYFAADSLLSFCVLFVVGCAVWMIIHMEFFNGIFKK